MLLGLSVDSFVVRAVRTRCPPLIIRIDSFKMDAAKEPCFKDQMRSRHDPDGRKTTDPTALAARGAGDGAIATTVVPLIEAHRVLDDSVNHPSNNSDDDDLEDMRRRIQAKKERLELQRREAEIDRELSGGGGNSNRSADRLSNNNSNNNDEDDGPSTTRTSSENSKWTKINIYGAALGVTLLVILIASVVGIICGTGNCGRGRGTTTGASSSKNANGGTATTTTTTALIAANVLCDKAVVLESASTNTVRGDLSTATAASGIVALCHGHDRGAAHQDPGLFYSTRAAVTAGSFTTVTVCGTVGDISVNVGNNGCDTTACADVVEEERFVADNGSFCHRMEVATTPGIEYLILVYGSGGTFVLEVNASMLPANAVCLGATSLQTSFLSPDRPPVQGDLTLGFIDKSFIALCHGHDMGSAPTGPGLWYKFQAAGNGTLSTVKVCSSESDVSVSVGAGCGDEGCANIVRDGRITENGKYCHRIDLRTNPGDNIVILVYGDPTVFTIQAFPSDLPANAVCEGALFIARAPSNRANNSAFGNTTTAGDLGIGLAFAESSLINAVCHGHGASSSTVDPVKGQYVWYKTLAGGSSGFTAWKVCGNVIDLSLSIGADGCALGCATVVSEERTTATADGQFCHRIDIVTSPGDDLVALVYGSANALFTVQAYESALPANVQCSGAFAITSSVQGNLSTGAIDPTLLNLCHGLDKGSAPSGKGLWYTFPAPAATGIVVEACGDAEEISMSIGSNGCVAGCATVESESRMVQNELFCHRLVVSATVNNPIIVFVYGAADAFSLTIVTPSP
jgi:hypothetical protein